MPGPEDIEIRPHAAGDAIAPITALLHRAYAELAALGLRYWATWQDDAVTERRIADGHAFLALRAGAVVGTITVYEPGPAAATPWYRRPDVAHFGQFAVEPALQRAGVGRRLLAECEAWAREAGFGELACDTAEGAAHLIRWYERLGYRFVEHARWPKTNYRSVVLSKPLVAGPPA